MPGDVAALAAESLVLWGVHTGLYPPLLTPSVIGALGSLRYSPQADPLQKFGQVILSTALGAWGTYPVAVLLVAFLPEAAGVPVMVSRYLVAFGLGYAGLALFDKRLGLHRRPREGGAQ